MTEDPNRPDGSAAPPAGPARLDHGKAGTPLWQRISIIWAVPVIALAVTLGIAWKAYSDRGTMIYITFADATGIVPGQTQLRFREVQVGTVESTSFTSDLARAVVAVRISKEMAAFVDNDARFWIVRPEVTAEGISRLDTVLSGVFIEGYWDATPDTAQTEFQGLPRQPPDVLRVPGTIVSLRLNDAARLGEGMPVLFRGLHVGRVQNIRLAPDGASVLADAVIDAPHDRWLSSATVFWDTAGYSLSFGPQGISFDIRSLAALVQGSVEFATPISGGQPVTPGQIFRLHNGEAEARDSLFDAAEGIEVPVAIYIDGSVRGLAQGAPVHYQSLPVGEVTSLSVAIVPDGAGGEVPMQKIILTLSPARMGLPATTTEAGMLDFLEAEAAAGLRARVASTGLLGTSLVVEMVRFPEGAGAGPEAPPGAGSAADRFDRTAQPPVFPTAPSQITDATRTAEGLFARLSSLPIEDMLTAATGFLNSATALVSSPELRETPEELRGLIADARALVGSEEIRQIPRGVSEVLEELRGLTADLRASGIDEKLALALDRASEAAGAVDAATAGLPELIASIRAVAQQAAAVRFEELGGRASALMAQLEAMLGMDEARALPGNLNATLAQLAGLLQTLREGGAVEALNATMQSAQAAADGVAEATEALPALTARIDGVVRNLDAMISTYGQRSTFNAETLAALRELRRTAAAVGSLAQTIERNPRALLTGR